MDIGRTALRLTIGPLFVGHGTQKLFGWFGGHGLEGTAIRKVHAQKGPWVTEGGYEYNAVLIAAMLALTADGPGRPSVDAAAFPRFKGNALALAQFAAAAAASAYLTSERAQPDETAAEDDVQAPRQERFTREAAQVEA